MSITLATRIGNTLVGAVNPSAPAATVVQQAGKRGSRLVAMLFDAPRRFLARLDRRQRERDALLRYLISEGGDRQNGRRIVERAALMTGRADLLLPSYFVNADRR